MVITNNDIYVMEHLEATITKMNHILDKVSTILEENLPGKCNTSYSRSTQIIPYSRYSTYMLSHSMSANLAAGFQFSKEYYSTPHLEIALWVSKESPYHQDFVEEISKSEYDNFQRIELKDGVNIWLSTPLDAFLGVDNQEEMIISWFKRKVEEMSTFKKIVNFL